MTTKAWLERLKAKQARRDLLVIDRREVPEGTCELCGAENEELRPYGPNDEWICFDCGMKNEATTFRKFNKHVFGEETH